MAAPTRKMNESWRKMTLALALSAWLLLNGAVCQNTGTDGTVSTHNTDGTTTSPDKTTANGAGSESTPGGTTASNVPADTTTTPADTDASGLGTTSTLAATTDGTTIPILTFGTLEDGATSQPMMFTTSDFVFITSTAGPTNDSAVPTSEGTVSTQVSTGAPTNTQTQTQSAALVVLTTGEPEPLTKCVEKDVVTDKAAVKIELEEASSCEETREKIAQLIGYLCEEECKFKIYQEQDSNEVIVTGPLIEADAEAMAEKFKQEAVKEELKVVEAVPQRGKPPQTVLIALLVTGLLLAALLIGAYCLKNRHRRSAKGMRLAEESYQADEENQGNTLVSVAPLNPPEPQEKPNINGESPEGGKSQPPPAGTGSATTNGHSTAKAPVADTEL